MTNTINPNFVPTSFFGANNELKVDKPLAEAVQTEVKARLDQIPDAVGDKHFLEAIADLSPTDVALPGQRKELFDKFTAAAQKFAATETTPLPYTGDIAKFLARVMIEFAGDQRQQALNDRVLARQAAQAEMMNQAGQQEKAATEMMAGAITNAVLGAVGGALAFAGSAASFAGQAKGLVQMNSAAKQSAAAQKTMDGLLDSAGTSSQTTKSTQAAKGGSVDVDVSVKVTQVGPKPKDAGSIGGAKTPDGVGTPGNLPPKNAATDADDAIAKLNQKDAALAKMTPEQAQQYRAAEAMKARGDQNFTLAEKQNQMVMTFGQAIETIGGIQKTIGGSADSAMQATAKKSEAEGSRDAADAEYAKQVADGKKEIQDAMNEMMKQIINFIKEMQDAEVEAMRAITRG
ncbi:hypothetical protein [Antarcticirhabdus aurantiaca]|uniref:Uncharacterized protein n=1 Tax=Antarcticirhabdus aurantiaca TaxID=2606717 RepID=A0ACD4NU04_9HYPH|nr:hypothetical protein [Antarcticirhabdus aurantiaca]WAJ30505.1 hypothetical protein OXU80_10000 [Jeongeuplla avenae]